MGEQVNQIEINKKVDLKDTSENTYPIAIKSNILRCCIDKRPSCGGFKWKKELKDS